MVPHIKDISSAHFIINGLVSKTEKAIT